MNVCVFFVTSLGQTLTDLDGTSSPHRDQRLVLMRQMVIFEVLVKVRVKLRGREVYMCILCCVYLVRAQASPIYKPVKVEGHYCRLKNTEHKRTGVSAILLLARPINILPGLPLS